MAQHPAFNSLNGKEVDGYKILVSEAENNGESLAIRGTLTDASGRGRSAKSLSIVANESDLATSRKIEELLHEIEDRLDEGHSAVRVQLT